MTDAIGRVLNVPAGISVPGFALRALVGDFADYLLYSQHVVPKRTLEAGFVFTFTGIEAALRDILGRLIGELL